MTERRIIPSPLIVLLVLVGLSSVGCQRSIDERNALMDQNREAQAEINRLRLANDALMSDLTASNAEASRLLDENARLRAAGQPQGPTVNEPRDTGFEDIDNIEVDRTDTTVTVRVASDILFASGKVDLRAGAKTTLNEVAGVLKSEYGSKTIRVEGYTDTDPIKKSGWKDNLELSLQRAAAVHRYLQQRGVSAKKMYAAGFGQAKPRGSKTASRRVEIVVVLSE